MSSGGGPRGPDGPGRSPGPGPGAYGPYGPYCGAYGPSGYLGRRSLFSVCFILGCLGGSSRGGVGSRAGDPAGELYSGSVLTSALIRTGGSCSAGGVDRGGADGDAEGGSRPCSAPARGPIKPGAIPRSTASGPPGPARPEFGGPCGLEVGGIAPGGPGACGRCKPSGPWPGCGGPWGGSP